MTGHRTNDQPSGCPCVYTTPCDERCTCVNPMSSRGCARCCTYGSLEQRTRRAENLARGIDAENAAQMARFNRMDRGLS